MKRPVSSDWHLICLAVLLLAGCSLPTPNPTASPSLPVETGLPATVLPTPVPTATPTPVPTATPTPFPTLTPTARLLVQEGTPLPGTLAPITFGNANQVSALAELKESSLADLAWSPTGRLLAIARYDGISLYEVPDLRRIRMLASKEGIASIAFNPRGSILAAGSRFSAGAEQLGNGGNLDFWRVSNWEPLQILYGDSRPVSNLAFSPDGKDYAVAFTSPEYEQNSVVFWDTTTWTITRTIKLGTVVDIAFSPDGEFFAASPDRYALKIWALRNGKLLQTIHTSFSGAVNSLAFAPDGLSIATGHYDGEIRLWNTLSGELILSLQTPGVVESLAFNSDGTVLASGNSFADPAVRLWDIEVGQLQRQLEGHNSGVEKLVFSPDSSLLASGSYDGVVVIWGVRP